MKDNVIKFPFNNAEMVEVKEENILGEESTTFAHTIIDDIHDRIHENTGECIFSNDEYLPLIMCVADAISGIYLMANGVDNFFTEIAQELYGDVDLSDDVLYDETTNENDEES